MAEIIKQIYKQDRWLVILTIITVVFLLLGLFLPPAGVIDNSVLIAAGELSFLAVLFQVSKAIDKNRSIEVKHKDTDITIGSIDKD